MTASLSRAVTAAAPDAKWSQAMTVRLECVDLSDDDDRD
jgi:hypothetical protein